MKSRLLVAGAIAVLIGMVIGCGGTTTTSPASATSPTNATTNATPNGTGTFRVVVKDSPFGDAKAVLVTFSEVSVHTSGGGWKTLTFADNGGTRTCDLKHLQTLQDMLGTVTLDAGHYTQVRFTVSSAALYFTNPATLPAGAACAATVTAPSGEKATLDIPSGQIILNHEWDLAAGATVTMTVDFDGDKSINQTGNGKYKMQPVIGVVSVQ